MEQLIIFCPYLINKRGTKRMCKALLISEVIINECIEKKYPLNTSKLQKILYFMQKEHLKKYNIPVFDEDVVAWECGPAIPEINDFFVVGRLGFETKVEQSIFLKDSHQDVMDIVLNKYGTISPSDMAELSKNETAWSIIWNDGKGKNGVIPLEYIYPPSDRDVSPIEDSKDE